MAGLSSASCFGSAALIGAPCGPNIIGPRAHHCGIAGANAPLQFIDLFLSQWLSLPGMRPRQLMLILPAVGFWFRCDSKDPNLAPGACKIVTSNRISHNRASLPMSSSLRCWMFDGWSLRGSGAHNLRCGFVAYFAAG